jgi:hypothetical protein
LRQHLLRPSQCFVLIKQSDSPCPLQFWVGCSLCKERQQAAVLIPSDSADAESVIHLAASNSLRTAEPSRKRPLHPTLRANPFPKVTDLFCRLPLPTLVYRPEAANLGDLMRILVRPGVRISQSIGFSRTVEKAPDISKNKMLYQPFNPISR